MRPRWLISVFLILAVIVFVVIRQKEETIPTPPTPIKTTQPGMPPQESWYEVYFSQVYDGDPDLARANPNSLDKVLARKLAISTSSIDGALHEIDSEIITNALIEAHRKGVKTRIVTETDYMDEISIEELQNAGVPIVNDGGRSGLMHNKFIVVDQRYVWTGSFNTTDNGAYKNNNNSIWIESPQLAANFTHEFNEMYEGKQFGVRSDESLIHPIVIMPDGTKISTYFAPENDVISALAEHIQNARSSIHFMAFAYTHDTLGEAMKERFRAGVDVRGVFETRGSDTSHSEYTSMKAIGMPVMQDTNKWQLHHKVIVIDEKTVITGSFNFSQNASKTNDENVVVLERNPSIARLYIEEFERVSEKRLTSPPSRTSSASSRLVENKSNINTMTKTEIERLPGIGPTLADRIILNRPYRNIEDLQRVDGLGAKKLEALADGITFE